MDEESSTGAATPGRREDGPGRSTPLEDLLVSVRSRTVPEVAGEGRRERKKRVLRQHISDVATAMFLERGFDQVRVSEVADACDVSEKTVYNHFPTKESLLLDREESIAATVRQWLGPGSTVPPVEAMVGMIAEEASALAGHWRGAGLPDMRDFRRFGDLVGSTSSLRAAQSDVDERLAQVAASAVAGRVGVDPAGPEPQITGQVLIGLWRVFSRSMHHHAAAGVGPGEVERRVMDEVRRAARLVDSGLWSLGAIGAGRADREQRERSAAAAERDGRRVLAALRRARRAWRSTGADAGTS